MDYFEFFKSYRSQMVLFGLYPEGAVHLNVEQSTWILLRSGFRDQAGLVVAMIHFDG